MTLLRTGPAALREAAATTDPFRPSDYTGMLIHAVRQRAMTFGRRNGLDMGVGSGVLLGALGLLGVECLWGVDIDPAAIRAAGRLLRDMGLIDQARLLQGSLWEPVGDERFDLVVANLPHFATTEPPDPEHSPYWSVGGEDGRRQLDPFLLGLADHLRDDGVAFITHSEFVGIDRTRELLAAHGLAARVALSTSVLLHPVKATFLVPEVREKYLGAGLSRIGPYEFSDVVILEIRHARTL
jgi:release factor glutamine methyltransferase